LEITELTKERKEVWNQFCLVSDDAWWRHTTYHLDFFLKYKPELKPKQKSFMVYKNDKLIAICSLIKEGQEFSFGNDYGPTPAFHSALTSKERKKVKKFVFKHIDKLAKENNIKRIRMKFPVLNSTHEGYNYLMKYGFLDTSINTRIIDLNKPLSKLRKDIRHGHDSDIDRASLSLDSWVFDKDNITKNDFEKYKYLHYVASGRKTRPDKTFDMFYDNIKNGYAFLVMVTIDVPEIDSTEVVSCAYFTAYKGNVYYGSSCNKPNVNLPLAHFVQWEAIKYMKSKYNFYETGWQQYGNTLSDFPSKKEINISKFKRGFGGFTVPLFRGEKFYDKGYFLKIQNERTNRYVETL